MREELSTAFDTRQYMQSDSLEIFYYSDVNLNHISFHQHEYYKFYFFLEGDVVYQIESESYLLRYGDYLLIPSDVSHRPELQSTDIPYRKFVLWLSRNFYGRLLVASPEFSYGFDYVKRVGHYRFETDFITRQGIQGLLIDSLEEKNSSRSFRDLHIRIMATSFLVHISRLIYDTYHGISPSYENVFYLDVCDYINNHLEEDLPLDTLAVFFYVSKYHISRIFKDNMGISLHQYVVKKCLQVIKDGILSRISFNQPIHQFGFHDHTSFYRAFKKEFGLSPTEFRKQRQLTGDQAPPAMF